MTSTEDLDRERHYAAQQEVTEQWIDSETEKHHTKHRDEMEKAATLAFQEHRYDVVAGEWGNYVGVSDEGDEFEIEVAFGTEVQASVTLIKEDLKQFVEGLQKLLK